MTERGAVMTTWRPTREFVQVAAPSVHDTSGNPASTSPPPPRAQPLPSPKLRPALGRTATLNFSSLPPIRLLLAFSLYSIPLLPTAQLDDLVMGIKGGWKAQVLVCPR